MSNVAPSAPSERPTAPEWERVYNDRLDLTLNKISQVLDLDFRHNPFRSLRRRFVLGHAPRVGSHLLCEHLRDYGALVGESFELTHMVAISRRNSFVSVEEFCNWLLARNALDGVFGVSGGVKTLAPLVSAGEIPQFIADWRFVHLTRDDFVSRAVSELIAKKTHAFTSTRTPAKVLGDKDYDASKLRQLIEATLRANAAWEGAFKTYGVEPYRLTYETLCADPPGEVAKVAAFLEHDPPAVRDPRLAPPKLEKQATSINERWAERFRAENEDFCLTRGAMAAESGAKSLSVG